MQLLQTQNLQRVKAIFKDLGIPKLTVRNIIQKFQEHETVKNLPGSGGKSKVDDKHL